MRLCVLLIVLLGSPACTKKINTHDDLNVDAVGLTLPQTQGWTRDTTLKVENSDTGGIVLRVTRIGGVLGSPRIDVILEPVRGYATHLDEYLTRNLREMAVLEEAGKIKITKVEQEELPLGDVKGYLVKHNYTVGEGGSQIALSQISYFCVIAGRGVTISAGGRTELFYPLSTEIENMIRGIVFGVPGVSISHRENVAPNSDKVQEVVPDANTIPQGLEAPK